MKILITTTSIMLSLFLFSFSVTENEIAKTTLEISGCQDESAAYCSGYADGLEAGGAPKKAWTGNYNKCMKKRGCADETLPISQ